MKLLYIKPGVAPGDYMGERNVRIYMRSKEAVLQHLSENAIKTDYLNKLLPGEALFFFNLFEKIVTDFAI